MTKVSITKAFSMKKTLIDRFNKEVKESKLIGVKVGFKMSGSLVSYAPSDFEKQASEKYQSIRDIMKRISEIITKIDQSNFITKVKIGGSTEMTVLEAIRKKDEIERKETLLVNLKSQLKRQRDIFEDAEESNRNRIERMVSEQTAAGNKDKDLELRATENIESMYGVSFIDPIGLSSEIERLEKEIEDFKCEVDYVLSASNSTTYIELD